MLSLQDRQSRFRVYPTRGDRAEPRAEIPLDIFHPCTAVPTGRRSRIRTTAYRFSVHALNLPDGEVPQEFRPLTGLELRQPPDQHYA